MKILYDHQAYVIQDYGGISRYFYELSKSLRTNNEEIINSVKFSDNVYTVDKSIYNSKFFLSNQSFKGKRIVQNIFNRQAAIKILNADQYDIFHPTYYNNYFLEVLKKDKPLVVTFFDLINEKLNRRFSILSKENFYARKILLKRADLIIAISKSTKQDLIEIYGVDPKKVEITYLGNSLLPSTILSKQKSDKNYILFVGNRGYYKNFNFFISAISSILKREESLKVVCAGGGIFTKDEINNFHSLNIENKVEQKFVNDQTLAELYSNALFFVFPTLYEGFGIPILEAFACSCPAVVSNTSSLPEIGGEAVIYIDPDNKDDIMDKVERVLYDRDLRIQLKQKGIIQLQKFSWQKMTEQTTQLYKHLL